ncbi:MAG: hypothetical protein XE06_1162 [Anaerolineaceae bacterium 46_22]|nr:MAG: hypothetical protein XE06_1162 [Anaerolineaceae bacterium 46_22]
MEKAALRGEPSYVWRDGQQRRLQMIIDAASKRLNGKVLVDGCGLGMYLHHLAASRGKNKSILGGERRGRSTAIPVKQLRPGFEP